MDAIPRILYAQTTHPGWVPLSSGSELLPYRMFHVYDSHMANVAFHKVVLENTNHFVRYMTGQGTAAGSIPGYFSVFA